jgi:uncharacterized protein (TIGR00369 family)
MNDPEELISAHSKTPVNRYFGFRLVSRSQNGVEISMEVLPDYLQEEGVVQGGIISAIADNAAVYAFIPDLADDETMTSIEFKLNFLHPVMLDQGSLIARSRIVRRGRTIGVCDVEVMQSGNLVAKGSFTYLFIR